MLRVFVHAIIVAALTLLTQLGGLAWLIGCCFRRRLIAFALAYAALSLAALWVAPLFGRVPLTCGGDGPLRAQSWLYCALNRNYVAPEMKAVLEDAAAALAAAHPGAATLALDGNFPFIDGFPLLPHLSHDDGRKADIALFYSEGGVYLPGATRSPIGYFAFEPGPTDCPDVWPTLRWDLTALQRLWAAHDLDRGLTRDAVLILAADPRVGKILLEPHLAATLGVAGGKVRFQGCRAARHDDHIHLQLR